MKNWRSGKNWRRDRASWRDAPVPIHPYAVKPLRHKTRSFSKT